MNNNAPTPRRRWLPALFFALWLLIRTWVVKLPVPLQPVGRNKEPHQVPHAQQQPPERPP